MHIETHYTVAPGEAGRLWLSVIERPYLQIALAPGLCLLYFLPVLPRLLRLEALACGCLLLLGFLAMEVRVRLLARRLSAAGPERGVTFTEEGFAFAVASKPVHVMWSKIKKVRRHNGLWVFTSKHYSAAVLPEGALTNEQSAELESFLAARGVWAA
ncbi:YcxB family protein [Streptacidiphilus monticola]|uniref:YcxB family protein n=1 Tax=Streptacidiphilus monticola TaxID=2161674 RepID=A0ABW1G642_9ACTN